MKKLILTTILLVSTLSISAQSDAVLQFRQIVNDIPNHFDNLKKDLLEDNAEKKIKLFSSKIEDMPISKNFISVSETNGHIYLMSFNVENMLGMKLKLFNIIMQDYLKEINDMVKTGNYTGRDFNSNGEDYTELTDKNGNVTLQYISNPKEHLILFFDIRTK